MPDFDAGGIFVEIYSSDIATRNPAQNLPPFLHRMNIPGTGAQRVYSKIFYFSFTGHGEPPGGASENDFRRVPRPMGHLRNTELPTPPQKNITSKSSYNWFKVTALTPIALVEQTTVNQP